MRLYTINLSDQTKCRAKSRNLRTRYLEKRCQEMYFSQSICLYYLFFISMSDFGKAYYFKLDYIEPLGTNRKKKLNLKTKA